MICQHCGRYEPPDRETGYDADPLCPTCQAEKDNAASDDDWDRRRDEKLTEDDLYDY